jgi:hypothetical protein
MPLEIPIRLLYNSLMQLDRLSPETVAWLKAQVQQGHFASYEDASTTPSS